MRWVAAIDGPTSLWRWAFKLAFGVTCAWFSFQYADSARYSLGAPASPLQLGDVTTLSPVDIPHNTFVCLNGISEHRGMSQQIARHLGQGPQLYWYFRLLGSRGVFVEVLPDAAQYSTTQAMAVCGRAVDPQRSPLYRSLIAAYADLFHTEVQPPTRLVQVGHAPGTHRRPYLLAGGLMATALAAQAVSAVTTLRGWRRRAAG
jgi:hypothetical protein